MAVCDICNSPGTGTLVSAEQMREAVFANGFNPIKLGLFPNMVAGFGFSNDMAYTHWKNTVVAQDTSDWNVCSKCLAQLQPYLKGKPTSTGVRHSNVSYDAIDILMAGVKAKQKYQTHDESPVVVVRSGGAKKQIPDQRTKSSDKPLDVKERKRKEHVVTKKDKTLNFPRMLAYALLSLVLITAISVAVSPDLRREIFPLISSLTAYFQQASDSENALPKASESSSSGEVEQPSNAPPPITDDDFLKAVEDGDITIVQTALRQSVSVQATDENENTALILAAQNGHLDITKLLLEQGADVHAQDKNGGTALMWAAYNGHVDTVALLLDHNADVNAKSNLGNTALMTATMNAQTDVVKLLLEHGAHVNPKNEKGETAIMIAEKKTYNIIVLMLKDAPAIRAAIVTTIDNLIDKLKRSNDQEQAAKELVEIGSLAIAPLTEALKDTQYCTEWCRFWAVNALSEIGTPGTEAPLVAALKDITNFYQLELLLVEVLEKRATPRSVNALIDAAVSHDNVRGEIVEALKKLAPARAIDSWSVYLKDTNPLSRRGAIKALVQMEDPHIIDLLTSATKDTDEEVRMTALSELEKRKSSH